MKNNAIILSLEELKQGRLAKLASLKEQEHRGEVYEYVERVLKEFLARKEIDIFRETVNQQMDNVIKEIGLEGFGNKGIKDIIADSSKQRYDIQRRIERSDEELHKIMGEYPNAIVPILRLLLEIDYLENRIHQLKKEAGLLKED